MSNRRIKETIGIRYDDFSKMETIISQIKEMLKNHPDIDSEKTLIVNFNYFAPSSLDFFIYTFTKTTKWVEFHQIKQNILLRVLSIIAENEAEVAFPTSTIQLANPESFKNSETNNR
jgi:MscS family membrane protein